MFPGRHRAEVNREESPGILGPRFSVVNSRTPFASVYLNLESVDFGAVVPGGTVRFQRDRAVLSGAAGDSRDNGFQIHSRDRAFDIDDLLSMAFAPDGDVIAAHESAHVSCVAQFNASQPFYVRNPIPTRND